MQGKLPAGAADLGLAATAKAIPVDLELSLVIDDSSSINDAQFSQQIDGYAITFCQQKMSSTRS